MKIFSHSVQMVTTFWTRITKTAKRHFWFPLGISYAVIVLFIAFFLQLYLRKEYYNSLVEEAYRTDQAVIMAEESSLHITLTSMIEIGSEMATNANLYNYTQFSKKMDAVNIYYLRQQLSTLASHSDAIAELAVINEQGLQYQFSKSKSSSYPGIWNSDNTSILSDMYDRIFSKISSTTVRYEISAQPSGQNETLIHIAFPILGRQTRMGNIHSMLAATFQLDLLGEFLNSQKFSGNHYSIGFITDAQDKILYHADPAEVGQNAKDYIAINEFTDLNSPILGFPWKVHIAVDKKGILRHVDQLYKKAMILFAVVLFCGLFLLIFVTHTALRPVSKISTAIKTVRSGELNQKIEIHGEHEIWQLAIQYNQMIDSLKTQMQKTEAENRQKVLSVHRANEAEREALESQINAHFLCNTLGAINYSVMESGNEEVSLMLRKLSNILRYTFSRSYENVTIAQELAWVEQYLFLQKFRLMDVFTYSIDFPEENEEWPCCKLFLQPFVENSILHGFEGIEKGGQISIRGGINGDRLKISLADNGCGIVPEKASAIQKILSGNTEIDLHGIGIGIRNVVSRLRMFFGDRFEITMRTEAGNGTCFTFYLPIPPSLLEEAIGPGESYQTQGGEPHENHDC